jgi:DNA polymerase III subunit epsilon
VYLFLDTETTGLPLDRTASLTKVDNWPRLVQLAWLFIDREGKNPSKGDYIIKPDGFLIPVESSIVHGITTEIAKTSGNNLRDVLTEFNDIINKSEYIIGHNIEFDQKIVAAEYFRLKMKNNILLKRKLCTMKSATHLCGIHGNIGYKWPTLSELYFKLFNTEFKESHKASFDLTATTRCFTKLVKLKKIYLPALTKVCNTLTFETYCKIEVMDLNKQATWLKGFIEPITFVETITDSQIGVLENRIDLIIKTIETEYDLSTEIVDKAITIKAYLESLSFSDERNQRQINLLLTKVESLVDDIMENNTNDEDGNTFEQNQKSSSNSNSIPGPSDITEPIDDLPF